MKRSLLAVGLELIGIRGFYWLMAKATGDKMISLKQPPTRTLAEYSELRRTTRYFAFANWFRGVLYIPPTIVLYQVQEWLGFGIFATLIVFHLLCMLLEGYRSLMAQEASAAGHTLESPLPGPTIDVSKGIPAHWYFSPKSFENENLYRFLGLERIRKFVVSVITNSKLTPQERKSGVRTTFMAASPEGMIQFERETRIGEIFHILGGLLNVPAFVAFLQLGMYAWAFYVAVILWMDGNLTLLQRYHRVRVNKFWQMTQSVRKTNAPTTVRQ